MQGWQQFYEMLGGAAATLLGLLFVAVSMNAEIILSSAHKHSRQLAEQAFQNYLAVLVVSLLVELPDNTRGPHGYTLLVISAIWAVWSVIRMRTTLRQPLLGESRADPLRRFIATILGFGLIAYAAYKMVTGQAGYADMVASGAMLLLISATISSWQLLTRVAEDKYREHKN